MTRLVLRYAARSDVGLIRQGNEDSGYAGAHLLAVADGMGGHAAGELASATAVAVLAELDCELPEDDALPSLSAAISEIHSRLAAVVTTAPEAAGMGTTVTAIAWDSDRLAVAHVGDSRAYLWRRGVLHRLTRDHTFVQTLVDSGRITEEEAATHRKRNLLIKAVDGLHDVDPDLSIRQGEPGDRYLLCSDGLTGVVGDRELEEILSSRDATGAVTALVEKALEAGAPDNVTCVVADVVEESGAEPTAAGIPEPVVVGAAAELRTRDRLPGIEFPADARPDPDRVVLAQAGPAVPVDDGAGPRQDPPRRAWLVTICLIVIVLAAGMAGTWYWASNQYFVSDANGYVAIYRGVPIGTGQHGWSRVEERSSTAVSSLPYLAQDRVRENIRTTGLDAARNVVAALSAEAAMCQIEPLRPGCPPITNPQGGHAP